MASSRTTRTTLRAPTSSTILMLPSGQVTVIRSTTSWLPLPDSVNATMTLAPESDVESTFQATMKWDSGANVDVDIVAGDAGCPVNIQLSAADAIVVVVHVTRGGDRQIPFDAAVRGVVEENVGSGDRQVVGVVGVVCIIAAEAVDCYGALGRCHREIALLGRRDVLQRDIAIFTGHRAVAVRIVQQQVVVDRDVAAGRQVSARRQGQCRVTVEIQGAFRAGLDRLVDDVYLRGSNYKMQGQLFWVPLAAAEFAILDLLGKVAKRSAADLLGGQRRKQINLYIANNHRTKDAQESLRRIIKSVKSIDAKALKFKIGGRMKVIDEVPNRTEKLIPMVAKALGDRCTLYADANSSYLSVKKAIEVGKILEANGVAFYEEPVPFDYLDETKRVAEALNIPIAWGEQESSQWRFKWMVENSGVRIFQPDIFYYGGLIRSLRVAQMAAAKGFDCTPHISGGGLGFLYMGIYAACCPNPGPHQEYKGLTDDFPWESTGDKITVKNGSMTAPNGHGIGVDIDPDYLANVDRVK